LAVSIAAAIQNARLYEQAQIYGAELEKRLADLRQTQRALEQAEQQRLVSEDKFHSVFRCSPVAFSITTFDDGRFVDVNQAFEQRYGFSRFELVERTVFELNFWEDRADRAFLIAQLKSASPVRNLVTRLRTKSGELKLTAYSASRIRFEGQPCVLAVSGDIPQIEVGAMN
jgi:PAS domain S-box-containing protein